MLEDLIPIQLLVDPKIISESLERIGIANKSSKVLYPTCYLFYINCSPFIMHFKQIYSLQSDRYNNVSDEDLKRRNSIMFCLKKWKMIDFESSMIIPCNTFVFVLPYKEKINWKINHKINLNNKEI
jgi:hypothetical protein